MSVSIHLASQDGIEAGPPEMLFQTRPVPKSWNLYDDAGRPAFPGQHSTRMDRRRPGYCSHKLDREAQTVIITRLFSVACP